MLTFCDSPFSDFSLRTSMTQIYLAKLTLFVHLTAWQPECCKSGR